MRAIILAAGQGSRLRPLTDFRPKAFVNVRGVPIIERACASLRAVGIDRIAAVTGWRADCFDSLDLDLRHNARFAETNMVESLACAADLLDDEVLMVYGDIVVAPRVLEALLGARAHVALAINTRWRELWELRMPDPLADAETLRLRDGYITEIGRRPRSYADIEGQYMGLVLWPRDAARRLARELTALIPAERGSMFMTSFLQQRIDAGLKVLAVPVAGGWLEIDTPKDLDVAEERAPYVEEVFAALPAMPWAGRKQPR